MSVDTSGIMGLVTRLDTQSWALLVLGVGGLMALLVLAGLAMSVQSFRVLAATVENLATLAGRVLLTMAVQPPTETKDVTNGKQTDPSHDPER